MKILIKSINISVVFLAIISIVTISIIAFTTAVQAVSNDQKQKENQIKQISQEIANAELTEEEQKALELINKHRKENGLTELKPLSSLQKVAKLKADDLVNNKYFSHTSPNLGTPFEMLRNNNVRYQIAGENLAGNINYEKAVEAWMNSTSHRENILESRFEYTGICAVESQVYGMVYVQLFVGI